MTTEYINWVIKKLERDLKMLNPEYASASLQIKAKDIQSHIAYLKQHENYKG